MVRTLLADHGELSLIGLKAILEEVPRVEIVATASDSIAMQALLVRHKPDVVLIDHTSDGFDANAIREGRRRSKRTTRGIRGTSGAISSCRRVRYRRRSR